MNFVLVLRVYTVDLLTLKRRMWAMTPPTMPRPHPGHMLYRSRDTMFSVRSDIPELAKTLIKPWLLVASMTRIVLRSHSRPSEVPLSEQNRMLQRSRAEFASPTGRRSKDLFFLLTPTDKDKHQTLGRGEKTAKMRMQLKKSRSSRQLLKLFHNALQDGKVDASVVGAALQRCGQGLWWNALIKIRKLQEQHGIVLHCIEHNIFNHALASCLKCRKCTASQMNIRKAKAFRVAREIWGHPVPSNAADFNCALSSAFQVCARAGSSEAFTWADELWTWSEGQPFEKSMVTYTARMFVYEMQGRHTEVDATLKLCLQRNLDLNAVVLGTLMEATAARVDPKRADALWEALVHPSQVEPNFLVYTAYAKVHLLSGQPQNAVSIIDELMQERKGDMDYKLAVDYLQALLIMCHSSLSSAHMTSLHQFLDKGATIVARKSAKSGKQNWKSLKVLSQKLLSSPENLCFKDLLVTSTASQSLMQDWENYQAGTNYLPLRD